MAKMHSFAAGLRRGAAGEAALLKRFKGLTKTDGRKGDFVVGDLKLELKTDYYAHDKTENFFIERYSDGELQSPGGPWQASTHDCAYYAYYYCNSGIVYFFSTKELVAQLEPVLAGLTVTEVHNSRWVTHGYKVRRSLLKPLLVIAEGWTAVYGLEGAALLAALDEAK